MASRQRRGSCISAKSGRCRQRNLCRLNSRRPPSSSETPLLDKKHRVIALDPYYMGESKTPSHGFLFALTVSTVGRRPLGIQASQINAVSQWVKAGDKDRPVHVHAFGPRTSLMALCAKAVHGGGIDELHLTDGMASLKEVIRKDIGVNQQPELFCFGLLENFDIPLLKSMAGLSK